MEFYITPDKREECEKKIAKMFKHFSVQPQVTYSPVQQVTKRIVTVYRGGCPEENGLSRRHKVLEAIQVTIEDIIAGEWTLVASVYYQEKVVAMVDSSLFKQIPEQYGLEYTKCDYCGGNHGSRKESHILYNNNTHEWKQVGSACIEKMVPGGKYLNKLMLKLDELIEVNLGGCDSLMWASGSWAPADNYWRSAVEIEDAIALVREYRENCPEWKKAEYEYGRRISDGTSTYLKNFIEDYKGDPKMTDHEYFAKVKAYVDSLVGGYGGWYGNEPNMNQKIKDAFETGVITVGEMYLAFFAQKGYEDSLTAADFSAVVENLGITKGLKKTFNVQLLNVDRLEVDDYYYGGTKYVYDCTFKDLDTGLTIKKEVSHTGVIDPYCVGDDKYKFTGTVKYIAYKAQVVVLGGRLSKAK
jgi:hypothetical protein